MPFPRPILGVHAFNAAKHPRDVRGRFSFKGGREKESVANATGSSISLEDYDRWQMDIEAARKSLANGADPNSVKEDAVRIQQEVSGVANPSSESLNADRKFAGASDDVVQSYQKVLSYKSEWEEAVKADQSSRSGNQRLREINTRINELDRFQFASRTQLKEAGLTRGGIKEETKSLLSEKKEILTAAVGNKRAVLEKILSAAADPNGPGSLNPQFNSVGFGKEEPIAGDKIVEQHRLGIERFNTLVGDSAALQKTVRIVNVYSQNLRAHWKPGEGKASVHVTDSSDVMAHELGHALEESSSAIHNAALDFRKDRLRRSGESLVPLSQLMPTRDTEKGFKGGFISPYTTKIYEQHDATEVISMGFTHMIQDPVGFAEKDPEHFQFFLHAIRNLKK